MRNVDWVPKNCSNLCKPVKQNLYCGYTWASASFGVLETIDDILVGFDCAVSSEVDEPKGSM